VFAWWSIALASLEKFEPENKAENTSDETDDSEPPANCFVSNLPEKGITNEFSIPKVM
jgi:hypothetical protein